MNLNINTPVLTLSSKVHLIEYTSLFVCCVCLRDNSNDNNFICMHKSTDVVYIALNIIIKQI